MNFSVVTRVSNKRKINKDYIKKRKGRKAHDPQTIDIMQTFKVEKTIAESIDGSMRKKFFSKQLELVIIYGKSQKKKH